MATIEIIQSIFSNNDFVAATIFCIGATLGQIFHGIKKWAEGTVDTFSGFMTGNAKRTVSSAISNLGGMLIVVQTGVLGPMITLPNGWWAIFMFGLTNGFSIDSAVNRAAKKVETQDSTPTS